MRVAVVNFCSSREDMLDFSSRMLMQHAGCDFDYFVVTWLPTVQVVNWIEAAHGNVRRIDFPTQPGLEYVPQLRAMMNHGFNVGYQHADWVCIVNTDMAFGTNWLDNLARRATHPDIIPNSTHITPVDAGFPGAQGIGIIKDNFGVPTRAEFADSRFWRVHEELYEDRVITQEEAPGGWECCATFPYLLHRQWWERYGPWGLRPDGREAPDRAFFRRCAAGGARFVICRDSIVYHHEAVERRGARPPGAEDMPEGV
jgi:hypothetical protein